MIIITCVHRVQVVDVPNKEIIVNDQDKYNYSS